MHTQTGTETRKSAYFMQRADAARRQLTDVEVLVIRYERDVKSFLDAGQQPPRELTGRLDDARRRVRSLRSDISRALHNAGRR